MPMIEMRNHHFEAGISINYDQIVYPDDSIHRVMLIKALTHDALESYKKQFKDAISVDSKLYTYFKRFTDENKWSTCLDPPLDGFPEDFELFGLIKNDKLIQMFHHGSDVSYESDNSEDMREYAANMSKAYKDRNFEDLSTSLANAYNASFRKQ